MAGSTRSARKVVWFQESSKFGGRPSRSSAGRGSTIEQDLGPAEAPR